MPTPSCVFLTMPTSGTGSMWRVITALTEKKLRAVKISEIYVNSGRIAELAEWRPEPFDHIYMYNTPYIPNNWFRDPNIRIVTNFRAAGIVPLIERIYHNRRHGGRSGLRRSRRGGHWLTKHGRPDVARVKFETSSTVSFSRRLYVDLRLGGARWNLLEGGLAESNRSALRSFL